MRARWIKCDHKDTDKDAGGQQVPTTCHTQGMTDNMYEDSALEEKQLDNGSVV